ncbi:Helicase associated domain protein, partial [Gemmatimonadota bacterium]
LWSEFPRDWGPDTGIDLVCEPVEGALWAVQAKAYPEGSSVTWRDLSTFVGASAARPEVGFLLLVTTASGVSPNALRNLKASGKPFSVLTRDRLLELELPTDVGLKDLRPRRVERFGPREHQKEAIKGVVRGFKADDRGQLIEACGTGKTLTALWAHEALKSDRTLVFVPSLALLAQTLREWTRHAKRPFVAFAVCSDETVTDADPMVTSVSEIGFPSTTDPKALREGLNRHEAVAVFATYQSSQVIEDALKNTNYRFDLMIADEAHRATGLGVSDFTRPLSDKHIPSDRRLFMTATPRIYGPRAKKAADDEDLLLSSMDDEAVYGPRFHTLSFSDAIKRDLLTDYRVAIVGVDDDEVGHLANSRAFVTVDGAEVMDASELAAHIAVAKAMKRFGTRRMLSFHSRISRAKRFGDQLPKVIGWLGERRRPKGEVWAEAVSGSMPVRRRRQILKRLEGVGDSEYGLVSNARCLGEGVDVPLIDGIAFVDPKKSQVDIVQAVGRAIRKAESKTGLSTIVLPVFISGSADPEETLGRSEFKTVWRVLDALRSHDDVLADDLDALRRGMGRGKDRPGLSSKIVFDLPVGVSPEFADALSLKLVEKTTSSWEYGFGVLQRFVEREGHAGAPANHVEDGFKIGRWVDNRRTDYRKGKLNPERVAALEAFPGWSWHPKEDLFWEGLGKLTEFRFREGHARVPQSHVEPDGFTLGVWVPLRMIP